MWAGVGLFALLGEVWQRAGRPAMRGAWMAASAAALLLIPAVVFALNHEEADRSGNWIPRDFAYNLLQSVEPWGILFTNGDNDTFPLWYLQEVEGVRRDVSIVNLALLNTTWYLEQLDGMGVHGLGSAGADDGRGRARAWIPLTDAGVVSGP